MLLGAGVVLLWAWTGADMIRNRAGWGYTVGIFLLPLFAVPLWWLVGRDKEMNPQRVAVARSAKARARRNK